MPCFLLLQMVPFQSNVDVATEVLLRDSPLLLGSCTRDRQHFPKSLRAGQSVPAPVRRDCYQPLPWVQDQVSMGAFGKENGPAGLKM